jgi:hypothetical protein
MVLPVSADVIVSDLERESVEPKKIDLSEIAGIHDPNDPLVDEWIEEMAKWREEKENDPNY